MKISDHKKRVKEELIKAGVTGYGLLKQESRYLHNLIHEDERIDGVIYGQYDNHESAMMVATNKRIIFLDRKPFFTSSDELTYDIISGVRQNSSGLQTAVTLHTRLGDYTFRYVNPKAAHIFVTAIEKNRVERASTDAQPQQPKAPLVPKDTEPNKASEEFLKSNDLGVLSTLDREGNVQGATVYYAVDKDNDIFILTKSETSKARNLLSNQQIALTVTNVSTMQTLQLSGLASVETDNQKRQEVFDALVRPRVYGNQKSLPPVISIDAGAYVVVRIHPTVINFSDFRNKK